MAKSNPFLDKLKAQADAKAAMKTSAHVELDTIAMLLAVNERLQVGPGRAPGLVNSYLDYKKEIAEAILKELDEDQSKKKEIVVLRRDLAVRMKEILGKEGWEEYKTLFPFLKDYW